MTELRPCPGCNRHVRDAQCPFCGHAQTLHEPPDSRLGRLSRAMVFTGAALAATACGGKTKKAATADDEQREIQQGRDEGEQNHPCSNPDPNEIARAQKKVDEAKTDEEKQAAEQELRQAQMPMCAPYGAPPSRRRVV